MMVIQIKIKSRGYLETELDKELHTGIDYLHKEKHMPREYHSRIFVGLLS